MWSHLISWLVVMMIQCGCVQCNEDWWDVVLCLGRVTLPTLSRLLVFRKWQKRILKIVLFVWLIILIHVIYCVLCYTLWHYSVCLRQYLQRECISKSSWIWYCGYTFLIPLILHLPGSVGLHWIYVDTYKKSPRGAASGMSRCHFFGWLLMSLLSQIYGHSNFGHKFSK